MSVQALERWVKRGALPAVRVPGSSRQQIDAEALLALAEEVADLRDHGERRGVVATALRRLEPTGRLPRKLRPTSRPASFATSTSTTPAERLRQGIALSELAAGLAAAWGPRR